MNKVRCRFCGHVSDSQYIHLKKHLPICDPECWELEERLQELKYDLELPSRNPFGMIQTLICQSQFRMNNQDGEEW